MPAVVPRILPNGQKNGGFHGRSAHVPLNVQKKGGFYGRSAYISHNFQKNDGFHGKVHIFDVHHP
jgi:hypothetical protein